MCMADIYGAEGSLIEANALSLSAKTSTTPSTVAYRVDSCMYIYVLIHMYVLLALLYCTLII